MNTYIVSAVVIKTTPTGFNTQNKLYEISAVNEDEAKGKVLGLISTDFPEYSLHTILAVLVEPNPWQQAIDDELVNAHLGVAKDGITREEAKAELNKLIAWHIDVAKYFESQAQQPSIEDIQSLVDASQVMLKWCVKNVHQWNFSDYDWLHRATEKVKASLPPAPEGEKK